jgi:membrane peptidoglycan carboxypeptidase
MRKYYLKKIVYLFIILSLIIEILFISLSVYLIKNNPPVTTLMKSREYYNKFKTKPIKYISIYDVPPLIQKITVQIEDPGFLYHSGIHISGIYNAIIMNIKKGYGYVGGSTITQQLGKTLFLYQNKTIIRKLLDIQLALTLDLFLTKDRIYELYLNYIEFGPGIYGIYNGSIYHFNKTISELSVEESVILITLISSPLKYNKNTYTKSRLMGIRYRHMMKFIERNDL